MAIVAAATGVIFFRRYEKELKQRAEAAIPGPWPRPNFSNVGRHLLRLEDAREKAIKASVPRERQPAHNAWVHCDHHHEIRTDEGRQAARERPAIDKARDQKRADTEGAERRESQNGFACDLDRGRIALNPRDEEQHRERNESSDPHRGRDEMQDIGGQMHIAFDARNCSIRI
jgi:hypothetical protein